MPLDFLTQAEHQRYQLLPATIAERDLRQYFHLSEADLAFVATFRGTTSRLGVALHLGLLRYLLNQPLRRKINTQLNKGEQLHALRSWLWFGGDGMLRRKQEEAQQEVVGCLNLLTNAVIVWNTIYMQEVITQLRAEGYPVQDEDLVHLSPAPFEHINRLGKYTFAEQEALLSKGLRPLRHPGYSVAPTAATA